MIKQTLFASLLAGGLLSGAVQANTITLSTTFTGGADTVTCEPTCEGLLGPKGSGTWDLTNADLFSTGNPSNPDAELELLNSILGLTGTANEITGAFRPDDFDTEASSFEGMQYEYFAIKKGQNIAFFSIDGLVNFSLSGGNAAEDDKWSHVTGFGTVVPIPAAAWLFGSALLGMAGIGYRRNRRS